jgi:hypothetical protein
MKNIQQKTVRDYMSAGIVAIFSTLGREQFDHLMYGMIVPDLKDMVRSDTGSERISRLAENYELFFQDHPEEFKHLVSMVMYIGIGYTAMKEVR